MLTHPPGHIGGAWHVPLLDDSIRTIAMRSEHEAKVDVSGVRRRTDRESAPDGTALAAGIRAGEPRHLPRRRPVSMPVTGKPLEARIRQAAVELIEGVRGR